MDSLQAASMAVFKCSVTVPPFFRGNGGRRRSRWTRFNERMALLWNQRRSWWTRFNERMALWWNQCVESVHSGWRRIQAVNVNTSIVTPILRHGDTASAALFVGLEIVAVYLAQASQYRVALLGWIFTLSLLSTFLTVFILLYQRWRGRPWTHFQFEDWLSLIFAVAQLLTSLIDYVFYRETSRPLLNFSVVPLVFALFVLSTKIVKRSFSRLKYRMDCCGIGLVDLELTPDGHMFRCAHCTNIDRSNPNDRINHLV